MDKNSMVIMQGFSCCIDEGSPVKILDIGSCDIDGCYKELFNKPKWSYTGVDFKAGKNVDIVVDKNYEWNNIETESVDILVSGNYLSETPAPWKAAKSIERIIKPGGIVFVTIPWMKIEYVYPADCYRILPDGLVYLFTKEVVFEKWICGLKDNDSFFCGQKPGATCSFAAKSKLTSFFTDLLHKGENLRLNF